MAARSLEPPLVVIVGPTASGKTSLAIEVAEHFGGEIICADSRTIYKGMNIGTAKPTHEERTRVPHYGLDLIEPGERFSAADFKRYANKKIAEIRERGRVPLLVGGTGLYIDAVLFDYQFGVEADSKQRAEFEAMTLEELHDYCIENNVSLPENSLNKRYVIRAIEQKGVSVKRSAKPIDNSFIVGITTDREVLRNRISKRIEQLFDDGVVDEATMLSKKYGWNNEAMTGNIYRLIRSYLEGEQTLEEIKVKATTADWRLAKRQITWLKRNHAIHWLDPIEARNYLFRLLAKQ
ncbi:MAG TPA: tRNA (adenosine(37)-N6)-dimethylallyltransferase MiaA [Candidatus Chromulinivoraceae bacterium]|nr:tRNA (adenosine(37)-N6)-dimethylallyltransferase MiaA [Candidatus Chromulinivoraceae bacterium]